MRSLLASKRRFAGYPCKLNCGKVIREKEVVLHQRLPNAAYGERDWVCHARCMDNVVAGALKLTESGGVWAGQGPTPSAHRRFDRLKERMLAEGDAFVEL